MIIHPISRRVRHFFWRKISHMPKIIFTEHENDIIQPIPFPKPPRMRIPIIILLDLFVDCQQHRLDHTVLSAVLCDHFLLVGDNILQNLNVVRKGICPLHHAIPLTAHTNSNYGFIRAAAL